MKTALTKASTEPEIITCAKPERLPFTYGCDPEFALFDKQKKMFISAHDLIPGTKAKPHKVNGGAIQVDGLMVEFNIDPAKSATEFVSKIDSVLSALREYLPEDKYDFVFDPIVVYDKTYFDSLPESVKELGCSPDFNAWKGGGINQSPEPVPFLPSLRTCSGHIHIGWTQNADITDPSHLWDCRSIIRLLDCSLYKAIQEVDLDRIRSMMYGKLGAFRPKPYGVEWRVPSNFWMKSRSSRVAMITDVQNVMRYMTTQNSVKIPSEYTHMYDLGDSLIHVTPNHKSQRVAIGARISPTAGKTSFDLNLDIPEKIGGKYQSPPNDGKGLKDFVLL